MIKFTKTGNSIERVIRQHYPDYMKLNGEKRSLLLNYSVQYMFKRISASKYTALVRKTIEDPKYRAIEMRRTFSRKGYFIKNIKLWLYFWYLNKPVADTVMKSFGILPWDYSLHKLLNQDSLKMFDRFDKLGLKAKTIREFDEAIEHAVTSNSQDYPKLFVRKMVYRKMRFIFEAHAMEPDDICKKLIADGIQAAMFTYPNITSMEHLSSTIKRTAHNEGMNFIDKYTTKGRGRLRANADSKFDSRVVVPIHSPEVIEYLGKIENAIEEDEIRDTTLSVRKVLSQYNEKQQYFIRLMSGEYDKKFTQWLKDESKSKKDNDVLFDRIKFAAYVSLALDYLGVSEKAGKKLIKKLKTQLAAHAA